MTVPQSLTLRHAASVIEEPPREVDKLVREWHVVTPTGQNGKGGQLFVGADALLRVKIAAQLDELPLKADDVRRAVEKIWQHLQHGDVADVFVAFLPRTNEVVVSDAPSQLAALASQGAIIDRIKIQKLSERIEKRLNGVETPQGRGKPSARREWLLRELEATKDLGSDNLTPDEIHEMFGREGLPWKKN